LSLSQNRNNILFVSGGLGKGRGFWGLFNRGYILHFSKNWGKKSFFFLQNFLIEKLEKPFFFGFSLLFFNKKKNIKNVLQHFS
jgi:hypothetical protein